jgi:hypothetical protein
MADGRCFTTYIPSCVLNSNIQKEFDIQNSSDYRAFLQKNALEIMKGMQDLSYTNETKFCNSFEYKNDTSSTK